MRETLGKKKRSPSRTIGCPWRVGRGSEEGSRRWTVRRRWGRSSAGVFRWGLGEEELPVSCAGVRQSDWRG